ncbi:hypothetical protein GCM10027405_03220 [Arthrobacter alkaliphilus]
MLPHGRPGFGDDEANAALSGLLESLEAALRDAEGVCAGLPLFAVEARLRDRLRIVMPAVRFTPEQIREWAARMSS